MTEFPEVHIYTDGGCIPNPGTGGWGAILLFGSHRKELSGAEPETTNNRMEVTACIHALEALKQPCIVTLTTDSQYVVQTMHGAWSRKKNIDLWQNLDRVIDTGQHEVDWRWVRGHNGHSENERAHVLAEEAIYAFLEGAA